MSKQLSPEINVTIEEWLDLNAGEGDQVFFKADMREIALFMASHLLSVPDDVEKEMFESFKKAWIDYPSQDNEGFTPDRGGFKCGYLSGAREWFLKGRNAERAGKK